MTTSAIQTIQTLAQAIHAYLLQRGSDRDIRVSFDLEFDKPHISSFSPRESNFSFEGVRVTRILVTKTLEVGLGVEESVHVFFDLEKMDLSEEEVVCSVGPSDCYDLIDQIESATSEAARAAREFSARLSRMHEMIQQQDPSFTREQVEEYLRQMDKETLYAIDSNAERAFREAVRFVARQKNVSTVASYR